jgi:hypothetical protein
MPPFFRSPVPSHGNAAPDRESAVADYLDVSRSPLRFSEPAWFALAEEAAWQRVCTAAGIAYEPDQAPAGARP